MTDHHRGWLPETALTGPAIDAALLRMADQWLSEWCAFPEPLTVEPAPDGTIASSAQSGTSVTVEQEAARNLGLMITGLAADSVTGSADRGLLEQLGRRAAENLTQRLATHGKPAGTTQEPSFHLVTLSGGFPRFHLTIRLDRDAAIRLRRRHAAPVVPQSAALDKAAMVTAVRQQPVNVAARVGSCTLPFDALRELGVGDTLLLQKSTTAQVDLVIDDRVVVNDAGPLAVEDSAITLIIRPPSAASGANQ